VGGLIPHGIFTGIGFEDINYYYGQGQQEVLKAQPKKRGRPKKVVEQKAEEIPEQPKRKRGG